MKRIMLILCLLLLTTSAWSDVSPLSNVLAGGYKTGHIFSGADTLYCANYTDDLSVADNITLFSNGKLYSGVIASITATYIELAGAWTGLTDIDVVFEKSNIPWTVNDSNGTTMLTGPTATAGLVIEKLGARTIGIDLSNSGLSSTDSWLYFASLNYWKANGSLVASSIKSQGTLESVSDVVAGANVRATGYIATADTMGVKPGSASAWNDSTVYQGIDSNGDPFMNLVDALGNLIKQYVSAGIMYFTGADQYNFDGDIVIDTDFAIASLDSAAIYVNITGSGTWDQLTNVGKNMWKAEELNNVTVVADSMIAASTQHKRLRASISYVAQGNNKTYTFKFAANGGTVITNAPEFESDSSALPQQVFLMGHWAPAAIGDALYIVVEGGDTTDIILVDAYAEASHTGH